MFRNRWIKFPLIFAAIWMATQLPGYFLNSEAMPFWWLIFGGLFVGLAIEGFGWLRIRHKYGRVTPEALVPHQIRDLMLMQQIDRAFETCKAAIKALPDLSLREVDPVHRRLVVRSAMNWFTIGSTVTIQLRQASDNLTEVTVERKPRWRTTMVDYGEGWNVVEKLVSAIKALDTEPTMQSLNDGASMLNDLTTRPINFTR